MKSVFLRSTVLAALLSSPMLAWSVSLGDVSVRSYLNEPFRAEIAVRDLQAGELEELQPQLAGEDVFERFGLEQNRFLLNLKFQMLPGRDAGQATILVTSNEIAREPFFSFLVELVNTRESLIREYTVLLDPNIGTSRTAAVEAPVQDAVEESAGEQVASAPEAPAEASTADYSDASSPDSSGAYPDIVPEPQIFEQTQPVLRGREKPQVSEVTYETGGLIETQPLVSDGVYGPVRAGETLWGIAAAVRPTSKVTMNQVMWSLYNNNQAQFAGSINSVRKNVMLAVPSEADMLAVSPREATALIAQANNAQAASASSEPEVLEIESAVDEPAAAEPELVAEAEPYYQETPAEEASTEAAAPVALPEPEEAIQVVEEASVADETEEVAYEDLPQLPVDDAAESELTEDMPADEADAVTQAPDMSSISESVATPDQPAENNFLMILAALAVVLGVGGLLFFMQRRKSNAAATPMATAAPQAAAPVAPPPVVPAKVEPVEPESAPEAEDFADTQAFEAPAESEPDLDATLQFEAPDLTPEPDAEAQADDELAELDLPEMDDVPAQADATLDLGSETVSLELNEDPISEADFQLAYGLYDEAALLLEKAIETTPDRLELHEKLAETHFAAGDAEKFKNVASALKQKQASDDIWQRVAIMGQQLCPDDDLFSGGDLDGDLGGVDVDMGFDDEPATTPEPAQTPAQDLATDDAAAETSVFEANFDELDVESSEEEVAEASLDEFSLDDLELDLDEDESASADGNSIEFDESEFSLDAEDADAQTDAPVVEDAAPADNSIEFVGAETDFGVDSVAPAADDTLGNLDLDDLGSDTDFELESADEDESVELESEGLSLEMPDEELSLDEPDNALSLDESDNELSLEIADDDMSLDLPDDLSLDLDAGESGDKTDNELKLDDSLLDMDDGEEAATESAELGLETDFDLGDETDFELDDLSAEVPDASTDDAGLEVGDATDFDLGEELDTDGSDFELGDETDFDLDDDSDLGDDFGELSLDDLETEEDDLNLANVDVSEIADGDEAGSKLDMATAYVEMGEAAMAKGLLEDVLNSGDDEQKAKAQELLGRL